MSLWQNVFLARHAIVPSDEENVWIFVKRPSRSFSLANIMSKMLGNHSSTSLVFFTASNAIEVLLKVQCCHWLIIIHVFCFESQCTVGRHSSSAGERGNHGYVKGKKNNPKILLILSVTMNFFFHINFKRLGKRIVVLVKKSLFAFATCFGILESRKTLLSRSDCWFSNSAWCGWKEQFRNYINFVSCWSIFLTMCMSHG